MTKLNTYQSGNWLVLTPHKTPDKMQATGEFIKGEPVDLTQKQ